MSWEAWGDGDEGESWADRAADEGWFDAADYSPGAIAILLERERQETKEGWTPEHDDGHEDGSMAAAAAAYAFSAFNNTSYRAYAADPRGFWPWSISWWKPKDPRADLVRAGALIAAEIDRLDRIEVAKS